MFKNLPNVLTADQLFDRALKKTKKIQIVDRDPRYRYRKTIVAQIESINGFLTDQLTSYVEDFPSFDNLHPFYQEILNLKSSIDKLKKALGAVQWAQKTINSVVNKQLPFLRRTLDHGQLQKKYREILGRIASILDQIDPQIAILIEAQFLLKSLPHFEENPTVVIAGYPNVGKSSLLRKLSHATPVVAQYPFTTQEIFVGHMDYKRRYEQLRIQLIDTPGLLDRPFSERNQIEKQAIAAVRHLADVIVFILDPSETCGYSRVKQEHLLQQIMKLLPNVSFIIVENKVDVYDSGSNNLKISCESGIGIDAVKQTLISHFM
jgi:nucleolar GTP-binding protein